MIQQWFWIFYVLIGLSLVLQMLEPSLPPQEEEAEKPDTVEVSEPPREEGREAEPVPSPAVQDMAARLARVEDRLDIERRLEVKDAFREEVR